MADLFSGLAKAGGEFIASSPIGQRMGLRTEQQRKQESFNELNTLAEGIQQVHEIYVISGKTPESKTRIKGVFGKLGLPDEVLDLALSERDTLGTQEIMDALQKSGGDVSIAIGPGGEFGGARITHKQPEKRTAGDVLTDMGKVDKQTADFEEPDPLFSATKKKYKTELAEAQGLEPRQVTREVEPAKVDKVGLFGHLGNILWPGQPFKDKTIPAKTETKTEYVPKTAPEIATPQTAPTVTRPKKQAVITPSPAKSLAIYWSSLDPRVQEFLAKKINAQPNARAKKEFVNKIKQDIRHRGVKEINRIVLQSLEGAK